MAVLTALELDEVRRKATNKTVYNYTKSVLNVAIQAIEDYWENTAKAGFNTAINTATSPAVLTVAEKRWLFAYWMGQKMGREGG